MNRTRLLLTTAACGALALGAVLAVAGPAGAAIVDPQPINELSGSSATLADVVGMAIGPNGMTWVTSGNGHDIAGFAPGATGAASPAVEIVGADTGLVNPTGLAVDTHGNVWVIDDLGGQSSIEEFAPGADQDALPIREISGPSTQLDKLGGIAIGTDGTIYVVNYAVNEIEIFAPDATGDVGPSRIIGGTNTNLDALLPSGIALEPDGSIVVSGEEDAIETFDADASGDVAPLRTISGASTDLNSPWYVAVDALGNIYASNYGGDSITEYPETADGDTVPTTEIEGSASQVDFPYPIAVDASDNLFVSNLGAATVTEYAANLAVTGVTAAPASTDGGETATIHGYGFAQDATVAFGGTPATDVAVPASTIITARVPAHAAGNVDVTVSQNGLTASAPESFTYTVTLATTGVDPGPSLTASLLLLLVGGVLLVIRRSICRGSRSRNAP